MFAGVDLAVSNVFNNHALLGAEGHTTRRILTNNTFKKLNERIVKTTLRRQPEHTRFATEQLNVSLVSATDFDRNVQDISQTAVDVVPFFDTERADLVEPSHGFQVGGAVFEYSK